MRSLRSLVHAFASLRVTVALLAALLATLAAGTIVESLSGAAAAARLVYAAPWFRALLVVFALNLACSVVDLWPFGRRRIGYAITHLSLLLVLGGALVTELFKTEGQLALWEGETSRVVVAPAAGPAGTAVATLPFEVRLDAFEIDYYEGTRMPAQYRSRLTVIDHGRETRAVVEMNRELAYGGWRLFQSSYREAPGRDQTILTASKDPGQAIVFLGYYSLVAGMLIVLATRIGERRRAALPLAATAALLALGAANAAAQAPPPVPPPAEVEALRRLPVQHDGRVMPLDTLAREAVFKVTGRGAVWGLDPVATALGWAFAPQAWAVQPIVPVKDAGLAADLGLAPGTKWTSFSALAANARLAERVHEARQAEQQERALTPLHKAALKVEARLFWLQRFFERDALRVVPAADPREAWSVPEHLHSAADLVAVLDSRLGAERLSPQRAEREIDYNRARPTRLAWIVLVLSLLASILGWGLSRRALDLAAAVLLFLGFGVMSWGIGMRWAVAGRIPASNMYESLLFLAWGVGVFALVATLFLRERIVVLNAAAMSALTMALTDLLPIDPFVHPMPPVLSGTYWLAIHVPIIMVGYSVLALGVVVAHMQLAFSAFAPARRATIRLMGDLLYWYAMAGTILLLAGILTGSMWAASSWGRYWGWDPKEVWSLVAFLAYMAILHARAEHLLGSFGVAAWSIVAFQTILMTYLGVNFVLSSGLHSYGFGESNVVRAMLAVALVEAVFLTFAWYRRPKPVAA